MTNLIWAALIGLGFGGLYSMLGMSVVVAYQGSGVINFAQGAIGMYSLFNYTQLRARGEIMLPWVNFLPGRHTPVRLTISDGPLGTVAAVLVTVVVAALLGTLVHLLVFRPLRNASPLGKVVASVGLLLYLQAIALLNFGTYPRGLAQLFHGKFDNFLGLGYNLPRQLLYSAVAAAVMALALWALYRFSRLGLVTRAAAESDRRVVLLGYSPDTIAVAAWIVSAIVGAAAFFIVGPLAGPLSPVSYDVLIVPALGAALVGLLSSYWLTLVGGLAIGMIQTLVGYFGTRHWLPPWLTSGDSLSSVVSLLVIATVLFARGNSLPTRGALTQRRLPKASRPVRVPLWVGVGAAAVLVYGAVLHGPWVVGLTTSMITAVLLLSFVVVTGYIGQISLAQVSLAGVAGYFVARLMSHGGTQGLTAFVSGPGLPMIVAVPIAALLAVVVGAVVGLPAVRIRGVHLAIITLAAAVTIEDLYFANPSFTGEQGGAAVPVPTPELFGLNLGVTSRGGLSDRYAFTVFVLIVLVGVAALVVNLRRSATGRRFLAIRANERAAASIGVDVTRSKLLAFAMAAGIAGLAGCLLGFQQRSVFEFSFDPLVGLSFVAFAYLGGISSVNGALLGGFITTGGVLEYFIQLHFPNIVNYWVLFSGLGLILMAIANPAGVAPALQDWLGRFASAMRTWRWPQWTRASRRLAPAILLGALVGYLAWERRHHVSGWPVVDGIVVALVVRALVLCAWQELVGGHLAGGPRLRAGLVGARARLGAGKGLSPP